MSLRSLHRSLRTGWLLALLAVARPAAAGELETVQFDLPSLPLEIFGVQFTADFLGPSVGIIIETRVELTFTVSSGLDAADIILTFQAPSEGVPTWQFSGADLGWSGFGTFEASLATDELNGPIDLGDPPPDFSLFLLSIHAEGFQPLAGQFVDSHFQVDIEAPGPGGDVDGNGIVDVSDLVEVILSWGPCPDPPVSCPADLDGNDQVDVQDLVLVVLNWS